MPRAKGSGNTGPGTGYRFEDAEIAAKFNLLCQYVNLTQRQIFNRMINHAIATGRVPDYINNPNLAPEIVGEDLKEKEPMPPAVENPALQEGYRLDTTQPLKPKKRIGRPAKQAPLSMQER